MSDLADLKTMLDIPSDDTLLDDKLNLIIKNVSAQLLNYLPAKTETVPAELSFVVLEVSIIRFNRIGNEGMKSFSQEGENITYTDVADDFKPFMKAIQSYLDSLDTPSKDDGKVRFL